MRKILALVPFLLLLGGCYDYKETDEIAIVSGIHISQGESEPYKLSFEIVGVSSGEQGKPTPKVTGKEGATIAQAIDNATAESGKKLYFGHAQVLAIDYGLAQKGIKPALDYFSRHNDMRLSMNVVITKNMAGDELFKSDGDVRSFVIADMLKANEERAITPAVELYTFIADSLETGKDSYLPVIETGEDGNISIDRLAVFEDTALTGEIEKEDTKYLMLLENIGERGGFILEREGEEEISMEIRSRRSEIKPYVSEGSVRVDIEFEGEFGVLELTSDESVLQRDRLERLEGQLDRYVHERIEAAVTGFEADVLGIEREILRHEPGLKADLPRLLENVRYNISTDVRIIDSGRTLRRLEKSR